MKLSTAFFYRFKTQLKFLSVFVGIFSLIPLIIPIINIFRNVSYNSTSSDVVLPAFFYFLGITIFTVRIDFKFFIQNSMSRNNIF